MRSLAVEAPSVLALTSGILEQDALPPPQHATLDRLGSMVTEHKDKRGEGLGGIYGRVVSLHQHQLQRSNSSLRFGSEQSDDGGVRGASARSGARSGKGLTPKGHVIGAAAAKALLDTVHTEARQTTFGGRAHPRSQIKGVFEVRTT